MAKMKAAVAASDDTSEVTTSEDTATAKKKRGDGIVQVWFDDGQTSNNRRVPPNAKAVVAIAKDKSHKVYQLDNIPSQSLMNLALFGFAQRVKTFTANHADNENDVLKIIDALYTDLASGDYYTKPEAKGKPVKDRSEEIAQFIEAYRLTAKDQAAAKVKRNDGSLVKVPSEDELERYKTKLTSEDYKVFKKRLKDYIENKATFKKHWFMLEARKVGKAKDTEAMDELI